GQEVQVKVLSVDPERKRISLSMRELEPDPWDELARTLGEGQLVEGVITKLTKFGAFASLTVEQGYQVEGLIHISELSDRRIEQPSEVVQEGQRVTLRVIKVERARKRIGLSLKRVASPEYTDLDWQAMSGRPAAARPAPPPPPEVEDFDAELEDEFDDDLDEAPELDDSGEEHEPA
ncbi:MAG TPA: S1 RNA-binding domain-containing protein, partial [Anaerolineales bacterium]|nr:S1 RNA-binding domain-containing protein [Anaerolineales bacterium]